MTYLFHPEAEAELLESIAFYELRRPGLGGRYLAEVQHVADQISRAPDRYPIRWKPDIRRVQVQGFPFTIVYRQGKRGIEIIALAHSARRPAYWVRRV